ncbi:hybrid sensor histidine kinase/response regulator [Niabella ginsenosidivorans]|uniref:histidine kinase n=1 Tax=Niabella ginsenosidivorans TaxID=1176587 RepID=A0A1A9HYN3_9BACT|nr:two-component regulator propeller domain-containing protein [Niabella ginsenosidivorans]ANH80507.1 hybrid sensor histidine kinase/response regulator [Niabella ginsenosidivorans]
MMKREVVLKLLLFCCLQISNFIHAQSVPDYTKNRYFRTISIDQGLSQSTVFAIQQDRSGFIWVGTQDGLNRYDGKTFTVYRPAKEDSSSLFSSYIRSLFVDKEGMLWIGGNKGISCYNYKTERFKNYPLPVKPGEWFISSITTDREHRIWIASNTGEIYYRDPEQNRFVPFHYNVPGQAVANIQQLMFVSNDLLLATDKGVCKINRISKAAGRVHPGRISARINSLLLQEGRLWMASESDGLFCLDLKSDQLARYVHEPQVANSLIDNDIRSLAVDESGNLWIGTFRGLSIFDGQQGTFTNFEHQATGDYTLSQNSVRCIFRDRQNGMWLGTFFGGLNYYHKDDIKFNILSQNTGTVLLNDQVVNIIKEDPEQDIWIGTNDKGINLWNRQTNTISYYSHKESGGNCISSNNIKALAFDANGNTFIGTFNAGLNILNKKSGTIKTYVHDPHNPASISGDMVHALLRDRQQRIWVGTRSGLDRWDAERQAFVHYNQDPSGRRLSSDIITYLLEDRKNRIWVGTINGINIFTPDNGNFEVFPGSMLSNELVTCIAEDQLGRVWVGTRDGLNLFDEQHHKFVPYSGPGNAIKGMIYGIQPDDDQGIWVSTGKGLVKLELQLGKLQLFNSQTGLGSNQPGFPAFCKTSDRMLLFGGLNGIIYFYPRSVMLKPFHLAVSFTGLDVFNTPVTPNSSSGILKEYINDAKSLRLAHEYKQFTIFFNAFNYIAPGSIKYYYMLKGFDYGWQLCENIPKATYSNLKPGSYTFLVKATGPLGEESGVRSLKITILPPWWRSNGFYLLVLATLAAMAYIAWRIIRERIKARNALAIERSDRERSEYLNQMKMDFFTNVSHEFKTPLTLIIAPLEEMLGRPVPEKKLRKYHERMLSNAKRLYQLVDQLMEFRKTEKGIKKLELSEGDIVAFLHEIYTCFLELSGQKNVKYYFKSTQKELICHFDKDAIEKICNNLLSNAFKYTAPGDTIELSFYLRNEQMILTVRDTGVGIAPVDHERVFERFYQVQSKEMSMGSGVGLAFAKSLAELHHGTITIESEPGHGTAFIVAIPLNREQYQADEFRPENHFELLLDNLNALNKELPEGVEPSSDNAGNVQHLLIVDDNPQIVEYLTGYFERQFRISKAFNGEDALKIVEAGDIDIIISDVMMPGIDGIQFCKKIKQNIITCHIPIILLTAKNETTNQVKGLEAGADDYVTKPFSVPLLEAKVQNIIRSRRRLKEYYSSATEIIPENIALNTLDEEFLRKAIDIIEESLIDPEFSVLKLSRKIGMSRSSLYLKLKAITGESTTDFIKRIKFKKAAELLERKEHSVTEVAYLSGFSSLSYFSTSFKQYYGYLPTEYAAQKQTE